jgi:hypothetical protein
MTEWIEQKAAEIKAQQEVTQRKVTLGREITDQLESTVRRDVEQWNALNPSFRRRIEGVTKSLPSGGFKVSKTSFPPATVEAIFFADSLSIQIEAARFVPGIQSSSTARGEFRLEPDADGGLHLTTQSGDPLTLEEASRILLEKVIDNPLTSN